MPDDNGRLALNCPWQGDAALQNVIVESFDGSFRDGSLHETLFSPLAQVHAAWKEDGNRNRSRIHGQYHTRRIRNQNGDGKLAAQGRAPTLSP